MIAAMDVGLKRIGLAISPDSKVVLPQDAVLRQNRNQAANAVDAFLQTWQVHTLIVGVPKGGSSEAEMTRRIEHFVGLLDFDGKVCYQDEYGSSQEAAEMMRGITRQKRDGKLDSLAAKLILQRWIG